MRYTSCLAILVAVSGALVGANPQNDPPPKTSVNKSPFTFPTLPSAPPLPAPAPNPGAVLQLNAGVLYVINSEVDSVIRAHPKGLVTISKKKGPRDITARFVDGGAGIEDRTFPGPYVFIVQAAGTGRVDLDLIPLGLKSESDIASITLDVDDGTKPIPPPKPKPDVVPKPKPVDFTWILVVEESSKRTDETAKVVGDLAYWRGLEARGIKWRHYDKDAPEAKAKKFDVVAAQVGVPAIILLDAAGNVVRVVKLPKTTAEVDAIMQETK